MKRRLFRKEGPWRGPKAKFTKEVLDEMADEMLKTIREDKTIFFVRDYFSRIGVLYNTIWTNLDISYAFKWSYHMCKQICSDRVHKGVLQNKLNASYARCLLPLFDPEMAEELRKHKKRELEDALEVSTSANLKECGYKVVLHIERD